eukprot:gene11478-4642_t
MNSSNSLYKQNFGITWTPPSKMKSSNDYYFSVLTRTLNGFYTLKLKIKNSTKEEFLTIVAYQNSNVAFFQSFYDSNLTKPSDFYLYVSTLYNYPRELQLYNAMEHKILFDRNFFNTSFLTNNEFIIELGANYDTKPSLTSNNTLTYDKLITEKFEIKINLESQPQKYFLLEAYQFEQISPVQYGISLTIQMILLIFCFALIRIRPLKAHGFVPIIALMLTIIRTSVHAAHFSTFEFLALYNCYFEIFVGYPTILCIMMVAPLHLLRFIFLLLVNERKSNVLNDKHNKNSTIKFQFKILKIISFPLTIPLLIFSAYFIIAAVYLILLSIYNFSCPDLKHEDIAFILFLIFVVLSILVLILVMIFDLIIVLVILIPKMKTENISGSKIPFYILKFLWKQDVFYVRLQVYVGIILLLFPLYISSELLIGAFYVDLLPFSVYYYIIAQSSSEYIYIFFQSALLIIISLINLVRTIIRKVSGGAKISEMEKMMKDDHFYKLFSKFAEIEFSIENVACFKDIMKYEKLTTLEERKKQLIIMKSLYFGSDAELEINVGATVVKNFLNDIQDDSKIDEKFLEGVKKTVIINLSDTYGRFSLTFDYKNYVKTREFMKELDVVDL